jgi:aminocarboxymuconate-semialdehyde decarboxylase
MIIDSHSHYFPLALIKEARKGSAFDGLTVLQDRDREMACHRQGARYELKREFSDLSAKLAKMDELEIDISVLSIAPTLFMYWADKTEAYGFCKRMNDCLAEFAAASFSRIVGLASLLLQDPENAILELRRAVVELGFRGAQIGASIEGIPLDDARYEVFFAEASELDVPLTIHPYAVGKRERMEDFQLNNLVGNPLDTCLAATRMIFSGFLDRYSDLKVILPHGGGYLPYQIGRMDRGYYARPGKNLGEYAPSEYLNRFYYDTILFDAKPLKFLYDLIGAERLVIGTDLPFDVVDVTFKQNVNALDIREREKELILFRNAQELFHIHPDINGQ